MIHDLVDVVERVLLVDDGVEQNSKGPYVLFLSAVGSSLKDLRRSVI
jgi:hypothetical protein